MSIPRSPEEEQAQDQRIQDSIDAFLTKPKPKRNLYTDHWWHQVTRVCQVCSITAAQFHNVPYGNGLPCRRQYVDDNIE